MTEVAFFDENAPLTDQEVDRLETLALHLVARGFDKECHVCALEATLVVRAMNELRRWRRVQAGEIGYPVMDSGPLSGGGDV